MIFDESDKLLVDRDDKGESSQDTVSGLRPKTLAEYVGQERIVETLKIAVTAALQRGEPLEHVLFNGPPGLGKTTLAHIIAEEMRCRIITSSGPALEKGGDLMGILTNLERGDVFFIDEIHRIPKTVEEFLYPAMEDFAVDFIFDKGVHARTHRYRLEQFTLIGATTRAGLLSSPLRERFGIIRDLEFYEQEDLIRIVTRSAAILSVSLDAEGAVEIARSSRGTPRIANRLLRRVRDYAQVKGEGRITGPVAARSLELEGIDVNGLGETDRKLLKTIIINYKGGPVGIEALSATLQLESDVIIEMIEPYLLKSGFLIRTSQGRRASEKAFDYFRLPLYDDSKMLLLKGTLAKPEPAVE